MDSFKAFHMSGDGQSGLPGTALHLGVCVCRAWPRCAESTGREANRRRRMRNQGGVMVWRSGRPVPACQCCIVSLAGWGRAGILRRELVRYMSDAGEAGWTGYFLACRTTMPGLGIIQHVVRYFSMFKSRLGLTVQSRRAHVVKAATQMPNPREQNNNLGSASWIPLERISHCLW